MVRTLRTHRYRGVRNIHTMRKLTGRPPSTKAIRPPLLLCVWEKAMELMKELRRECVAVLCCYRRETHSSSSGTRGSRVMHSLSRWRSSRSSWGNSRSCLRGPGSTPGAWLLTYSSKSTGSTTSDRGNCVRRTGIKRSLSDQKGSTRRNAWGRNTNQALHLLTHFCFSTYSLTFTTYLGFFGDFSLKTRFGASLQSYDLINNQNIEGLTPSLSYLKY